MAFGADTFKKAMGGPLGGAPKPPMGGAPGAAPGGMDLEGIMGAPKGIEDTGADIEGPAGEAGETSLEQALEQAGIQADPDQINKIKGILGLGGGAIPALGGDDMDLGAPPTPEKPISKLGRMFGK